MDKDRFITKAGQTVSLGTVTSAKDGSTPEQQEKNKKAEAYMAKLQESLDAKDGEE